MASDRRRNGKTAAFSAEGHECEQEHGVKKYTAARASGVVLKKKWETPETTLKDFLTV